MKHAIKLAAILAALTLTVSSFSACSSSGKDDPTSATASASEISETAADITEADITEEAATAAKIEIDSAETILNLIKKYPIGTAGSTAKSVDIAIRLVNFTENSDADDVKTDIEKFMENLSEEDAEMFAQCLDEIDYMAQKLLSGDTDSIKQYIEESKDEYDEGNYSTEKYEEILDIIKAE